MNSQCQTPSETQTDKETNRKTPERNRTGRILALKCDSDFNDYPDNQLTKFHVFIG